MSSAKQKLDLSPAAKRKAQDSSVNFRIPAPVVEVNPQVTAHVEAPQIKMDAQPFSDALNKLGAFMGQVAQQQREILSAIKAQNKVLSDIAAKEAPTPKVEVSANGGPSEYHVEFDRSKGQTVGMRITAETTD